MTFVELVGAVSEKTGLTKDQVSRTIKAFTEVSKEVLETGEKVKLTGFGTFYSIRGTPRPLFRGDRMSAPRPIIRFREKRRSKVEKRAVVLDDEKTKTASTQKTCPSCGDEMEEKAYCMRCGTEPFEKRPQKK